MNLNMNLKWVPISSFSVELTLDSHTAVHCLSWIHPVLHFIIWKCLIFSLCICLYFFLYFFSYKCTWHSQKWIYLSSAVSNLVGTWKNRALKWALMLETYSCTDSGSMKTAWHVHICWKITIDSNATVTPKKEFKCLISLLAKVVRGWHTWI